MTIGQVGTSNTFISWLGKTERLTTRVPDFIDSFEDTGNTVYANTNVNLAYDLGVDGTVTFTGNIVSVNSTTTAVGTDAYVYYQLNASDYLSSPEVSITYLNSSNSNITTLSGDANTQIYNTIANSVAAVSVAANIASYTAFVLALG